MTFLSYFFLSVFMSFTPTSKEEKWCSRVHHTRDSARSFLATPLYKRYETNAHTRPYSPTPHMPPPPPPRLPTFLLQDHLRWELLFRLDGTFRLFAGDVARGNPPKDPQKAKSMRSTSSWNRETHTKRSTEKKEGRGGRSWSSSLLWHGPMGCRAVVWRRAMALQEPPPPPPSSLERHFGFAKKIKTKTKTRRRRKSQWCRIARAAGRRGTRDKSHTAASPVPPMGRPPPTHKTPDSPPPPSRPLPFLPLPFPFSPPTH